MQKVIIWVESRQKAIYQFLINLLFVVVASQIVGMGNAAIAPTRSQYKIDTTRINKIEVRQEQMNTKLDTLLIISKKFHNN